MIIDYNFLSDNNITEEEYMEYYNSVILPKTQRDINEYGKVTITIGNISFEGNKDAIDEKEIINSLKDDYKTGRTITHFLELIEKKKEQMEISTLTPEEEWRNEIQVTLEYIACMSELNQ